MVRRAAGAELRVRRHRASCVRNRGILFRSDATHAPTVRRRGRGRTVGEKGTEKDTAGRTATEVALNKISRRQERRRTTEQVAQHRVRVRVTVHIPVLVEAFWTRRRYELWGARGRGRHMVRAHTYSFGEQVHSGLLSQRRLEDRVLFRTRMQPQRQCPTHVPRQEGGSSVRRSHRQLTGEAEVR